MSLSAQVRVHRGTLVLDVDVEVPDGQVVAVLGPNGAGKSTLLRALAGLAPLDDGALRLGGRPLDVPGERVWVPPAERRVGVVFQDYRLFAHLSARDNVAFGPRSTGTPRAVARARAQEWLARLGLGEVGDRGPGELSGGQAQRVALARALATGPDLLLLDEPLAALDPATRAGVRRELRRELAAFAGPALLVTHDLLDALLLADRVLVLQAGRVVQDGAPAEVTARPRTPYVAGVVGLNLVSGTAARGRITLDDGRGVAELPLLDAALCGPVLAAVTPSAVRLRALAPGEVARRRTAALGQGTPTATWTARVAAVDGLVDRVRVHLDAGPCPIADLDLPAAAALGLYEGASLAVEVAAADVVAYPALDHG